MKFDYTKYIRTYLLSLTPYKSAREEYKTEGRPMILLDANENPFSNGVNRYPDPQQQNVKKLLSSLKNIPTNQSLSNIPHNTVQKIGKDPP